MDENLSKTVRIDLMPDADTSATALGRNDLLAKANYSTRQRQAAVAAETVRSRYEALLESVYDAAVLCSPSGRILEVNGRAVEFLGYDREALCNMNLISLLDGADESVMRNISDTLLSERFALLQAFCRRQDDSLFPAEIAVNRLSGDSVRLCFFIRDVSVRYETEEMLRTEHTAIQVCASGIAICDIEGRLAYVNPAFVAILGQEAGSLPGRDMREVLGEPEWVASMIESALSSDETWMSEIEITNGVGEAVYLQASATCSKGSDGIARGIVFSFADITLHRRAEEASEAAHAELEARVKARTMDLLAQNDEHLKTIEALKVELATIKQEGMGSTG